LNQGIAASRTLYGDAVNPLMTAKAIAWFKDGDLDTHPPGIDASISRARFPRHSIPRLR
jgi:hypothetical protein